MKKGSFKKNTVWLLISQFYSLIVGVLVGPLSARTLGPETYGDLVYAENIVSIFLTLSSLGMDSYIVAELSANPDRDASTLGTALWLRLISGTAGALLSIVTVYALRPDQKTIQMVAILESIQCILVVYSVFSCWMQSRLLSQYVSLASILAFTASAGWKIYSAASHPDIYYFALAVVIYAIVYLVVISIAFFRLNPGIHLTYDPKLGRYFLSRSWQFVLASMGSLVYSKIDQIMVGDMIDSTSLAFYNVAVVLIGYWNTIPNAFITSAQPVIIGIRSKDYKQYLRLYQETLLGITLLSIAAILGALLLAKPVIVLLYGETYIESVRLFHILIVSSLFSMLGSTRMIWIVAEKYERYSKYFVYAGAVTDIVMNYILIKWMGVDGAAWATVLAEIVVFFIAPLIFKETRVTNRYFFECWQVFPDLMLTMRNSMNSAKKKLKRDRS